MKKNVLVKRILSFVLVLVMMFALAVPVAGFDDDGVWDMIRVDDEYPEYNFHVRFTLTPPTGEVIVNENRCMLTRYVMNVPVGAALTLEHLDIFVSESFISIYIPVEPDSGTGSSGGFLWNTYELVHRQMFDSRNPITYIFEEAGYFWFSYGYDYMYYEDMVMSTEFVGAFYVNVSGDAPAVAATPAPATGEIGVTVNGQAVNFADQPPVIVDGRTLVPVRGVFEALGFDVGWNGDLRQATLSRANDTIVITLDSATFTTNGISHTLEVPAQSIGGRTMLPIRAVLESVGYNLGWDGDTRTVIVTAQ